MEEWALIFLSKLGTHKLVISWHEAEFPVKSILLYPQMDELDAFTAACVET